MSTAAGSPADLPLLAPPPGERPEVGVVHLGLGAFFRAHGAIYFEEAMAASGGAWGVVGVSLVRPDQRDRLEPQGCAYTAVELGPEGETNRVVGVVREVLVAREDPEAVLARMADPAVRIVTLTVTEKGYCHEPSTGALNHAHPDIVHDLAHPEAPVSAPGFLVRALARRRAAGARPFTVLCCDNLPENGRVVRGVVLELARAVEPALADWIAAQGAFPSTMVDRIVPATRDEDIARLAERTGVLDRAPVMHEPFRQWVVEDSFVDGARPDLGAVGVELVADVTPYEHQKLRMLNGTHSALAYLGYLAGHETIAATVADPVFARFVKRLWAAEIIPALTPPPGVDLGAYAAALFDRYANPGIRHRTWQIAMDGSQKLPQRILGTIAENLAAGRPTPGLVLAVAAWMRYVGGVDETGAAIDVKDPLAGRLRALSDGAAGAEGKVAALLGVREVFAPALAAEPSFRAALTQAYDALLVKGARAAAEGVVG
ncbi:mannitol dehydrogenase family protein [Amaricoccus sp.]|uniref:mannitol dehydrogenase family protein n=1 Tax=Amaricoccus sp. TaxID=1872485 RepID=UPI001B77493A|nr:mannitol dehydrogenase family protein [Amaricoccus sp.]MBP7242420.1 mannitol dehydrogenase family protein [Amaricoccus sp.]